MMTIMTHVTPQAPVDPATHSGDAPHDAGAAETTIYFDGSCALCSWEISQYEKAASGTDVAFVDVSDPDVALAGDVSREVAMKRFHVRTGDGTPRAGAAGFVAVWEALPSWRWAARLARLPGVMPVLELAYRAFLPVRPLLSRLARLLGAKPMNGKAGNGGRAPHDG